MRHSSIFSAAIFSALLFLTGCGAAVTVKRMNAEEAWSTWRKDAAWKEQQAKTLAQVDASGLREKWKSDPDTVIAKLRAASGNKPELHSAVAILATELALQREEHKHGSDVRGLWLVAAQGAVYTARSLPKEVLLEDDAAPARFMATLYNRAVSHFVSLDFANGGMRGGKPEEMAAPGGSFRVTVNSFRIGGVNPAQFDELVPTDSMKFEGFTRKGRLPGIGATFSGLIQHTPEREHRLAFTAKRQLNIPLTAGLIFPRDLTATQTTPVDVALIDPIVRREIPFGTRSIPISRDCGTPLALELNGISASNLGLGGFLRAEDRMKLAGLYMLQPYDPNRIPVLLIHGLQSSPLIWRDIIAEMQADPVIGAKYQFWVFYYPSGMAVPFSRRLLVQKIEEARQHFDPQGHDLASRNMVVIGHSMGGVITHTLIVDVGDRFWRQFTNHDISELKMSDKDRKDLQELVFMKPLPQVKRAIFISTPHRGAAMAEGWMGGIASSLVRLPVNVIKFNADIFTGNAGLLRSDRPKMHGINSIGSLRPGSPIYVALDDSPFVNGVPYHSIIGDRGKGDTPNSSDGIVPYSSSHLDGAESELIVPTGHGAYESPLAIEEIRRILLKHVQASNN